MKIIFLLLFITVIIIVLPFNSTLEPILESIPELQFDGNIYIVSFANNCCQKAQKNLEETALKYGVTKVFSLNLDTLEAPDDVKNYIKNNKRGSGYWIWKPYVLNQILNISNPGDIIIYVDSSTYFNNALQPIIDFINTYSILSFKHKDSHKQSEWTKMDAVKYFGYPDDWCEKEGNYNQFMAAFIGIKNDLVGNLLVNKYFNIMKPGNSQLFDDSKSSKDSCNDFKESRHDQQILSLILYKYFQNIPFPDYNKQKYGWVWHETINGKSRHT